MYLALGDSTPGFPRSLVASRYLRIKEIGCLVFVYEAITLFGSAFQRDLTNQTICNQFHYDTDHNNNEKSSL